MTWLALRRLLTAWILSHQVKALWSLLQPLPPNAAPAATTESVPVVSIPFAVADMTVDSFTDEIKQALVDAITASIPATSNVRVYITNIREGSLYFDTVVLFLDGDSGAAQTLTDTAAAVSPFLDKLSQTEILHLTRELICGLFPHGWHLALRLTYLVKCFPPTADHQHHHPSGMLSLTSI